MNNREQMLALAHRAHIEYVERQLGRKVNTRMNEHLLFTPTFIEAFMAGAEAASTAERPQHQPRGYERPQQQQQRPPAQHAKRYTASRGPLDMTDSEKVDLVLDWSDDHPEFDLTFTSSVREQLDAGKQLSVGQIDSLDNIIAKWHIGEARP